MTTRVNTPSIAGEAISDTLASHDRIDHPALRAACKDVARPAIAKGLLASLLCSAALLTGSGAAFAAECVQPYTVATGETCSNMVLGSATLAGGRNPPLWADVENRGTINFDARLAISSSSFSAAISMFARSEPDPEPWTTTARPSTLWDTACPSRPATAPWTA